jgi:hypothetical protein
MLLPAAILATLRRGQDGIYRGSVMTPPELGGQLANRDYSTWDFSLPPTTIGPQFYGSGHILPGGCVWVERHPYLPTCGPVQVDIELKVDASNAPEAFYSYRMRVTGNAWGEWWLIGYFYCPTELSPAVTTQGNFNGVPFSSLVTLGDSPPLVTQYFPGGCQPFPGKAVNLYNFPGPTPQPYPIILSESYRLPTWAADLGVPAAGAATLVGTGPAVYFGGLGWVTETLPAFGTMTGAAAGLHYVVGTPPNQLFLVNFTFATLNEAGAGFGYVQAQIPQGWPAQGFAELGAAAHQLTRGRNYIDPYYDVRDRPCLVSGLWEHPFYGFQDTFGGGGVPALPPGPEDPVLTSAPFSVKVTLKEKLFGYAFSSAGSIVIQ